jgi:hypothetical protein
MRQRSYFRPSVQALIGFLGQKHLKQRAAVLYRLRPGARRANPVRRLIHSSGPGSEIR